jgi:3-oxoadipate enol-lactonase
MPIEDPSPSVMYKVVNGARLAYTAEGEGTPTILIHDRAGTRATWRRLIPLLSRDHLVIAFDSRGVGDSRGEGDESSLAANGVEGDAHGRSSYTVELLADDVSGLADELGIEHATLVGLSMGGGVAQTCALRHPSLASALVLVSSSPGFSPATRSRMLEEATEIAEAGVSPETVSAMVARWLTPEFAQQHPDVVAEVAQTVSTMDRGILAARSRANAERNLTKRLRDIACPVLLVGGAQDPMGLRAHAEVYERELTNGFSFELIASSSHLVPVEAPEQLAEVINRFLTARAQSPATNPERTDA